jgi:anti-sigma B factor antagonist
MSSLELDRIAAALYRLVDEQHRRRLLLDFAKVQYVSSQAIGMLMALRKKLTLQKGDALILCAVSPALMQLIKITGLDRVLTIKPQLADVV